MPIEVMAKRGIKTMLYGPMKPVGLEYPEDYKGHVMVTSRRLMRLFSFVRTMRLVASIISLVSKPTSNGESKSVSSK